MQSSEYFRYEDETGSHDEEEWHLRMKVQETCHGRKHQKHLTWIDNFRGQLCVQRSEDRWTPSDSMMTRIPIGC